MGVLDDGALRAEARQQWCNYNEHFNIMIKVIQCPKVQHTLGVLQTLYFDEEEYVNGDTAKLTMSDLDGLRYPFDKKLQYPLRVYSDTDMGGVLL